MRQMPDPDLRRRLQYTGLLQSAFSGYCFYDPETTPWIIGAILALPAGYFYRKESTDNYFVFALCY